MYLKRMRKKRKKEVMICCASDEEKLKVSEVGRSAASHYRFVQ